jgi:hypothetical protein
LARVGFRVVPVAQEHDRVGRADGDGARCVRRQGLARLVDRGDLVARRRDADGARPARQDPGAAAHDHVALGLTVELVHLDPEPLGDPGHGLVAQPLAAAGHRAQPHAPRQRVDARLSHEAQRGRRHEHVTDPVPGHEGAGRLRVELGGTPRHHGDAEVERGQQHVEQAADPGPIRGRPEPVAGLGEEVLGHLHARQVPEQHAVAVERALGLPRRAEV